MIKQLFNKLMIAGAVIVAVAFVILVSYGAVQLFTGSGSGSGGTGTAPGAPPPPTTTGNP